MTTTLFYRKRQSTTGISGIQTAHDWKLEKKTRHFQSFNEEQWGFESVDLPLRMVQGHLLPSLGLHVWSINFNPLTMYNRCSCCCCYKDDTQEVRLKTLASSGIHVYKIHSTFERSPRSIWYRHWSLFGFTYRSTAWNHCLIGINLTIGMRIKRLKCDRSTQQH